jgi:hypothetical protein
MNHDLACFATRLPPGPHATPAAASAWNEEGTKGPNAEHDGTNADLATTLISPTLVAAIVPAPEARLRIGGCDVLLLGTIAGFVPDGARVGAAFATFSPDRVALGIPAEDLEALRVLAAAPEPQSLIGAPEAPRHQTKRRMSNPGLGTPGVETLLRPSGARITTTDAAAGDPPFAGLDSTTVRFLELLKAFGATAIPSPDLQTAWRIANERNVPIVAIDLDDVAHAAHYTGNVGLFGLMGRSRAERRAAEADFAKAADAYELAARWDANYSKVRSLRRVEEAREQCMAARTHEEAGRCSRLLAIVPAARHAGVLSRLSGQSLSR